MPSKLDTAWNRLEEHFHIVDEIVRTGSFFISADQIKNIGQREPRLMTKFDTQIQQPRLFNDNNLSILPTGRGDYVIAKMNLFGNLTENNTVETGSVMIPEDYTSLNLSTITSESLALSAADISGVFNDFLGEDELHTTVCGRMGSGVFNFNVNGQNGRQIPISVINSQEEIDGSQECARFLALIEAKNKMHPDFMIRQLYYPMRTWNQKLPNKFIRNIYMQYSNGEFYLREYGFADINVYNSLELLREKKYILVERNQRRITAGLVLQLLENTQTTAAPDNVPFPQCDEFRRIIYLCELFWEDINREWTKDDLYQNISFGSIDKRQVDYYLNGALYIRLIQCRRDGRTAYYKLADLGLRIMSATGHNERTLNFIEAICRNELLKKLLKSTILSNVHLPDKADIIAEMRRYNLFDGDAMYDRRATTVRRWINWVLTQIEE